MNYSLIYIIIGLLYGLYRFMTFDKEMKEFVESPKNSDVVSMFTKEFIETLAMLTIILTIFIWPISITLKLFKIVQKD